MSDGEVAESNGALDQALPDVIAEVERNAISVSSIPVHISYEIIHLFSEGLYQSPQKAIEELVSNGYDAGASQVHVLLPDEPDVDNDAGLSPLWVIDDGHGLDAAGFAQLWKVADSKKAAIEQAELGTRLPIGQFGIGKLAAYVLAWRLTHISRVNGAILLASMNFRRLSGIHQYDSHGPLELDLRSLTVDQAKQMLSIIEQRDPKAWQLLFGDDERSWTVAALSDFKNLYKKLKAGRLSWVLSTGLPLHSDFGIWLNGQRLVSSKESRKLLLEHVVGNNDTVAASLSLEQRDGGVVIPDVGVVTGRAEIYEKKLTQGKSDQYGRSHGFFVRVRGRVINLEDELFGLDALNHAAWARFSMEIDADGLRGHLLSSREGVRESEAITQLRVYMHGVFNACRKAYDEWVGKELAGVDLNRLLRESPSAFITEPLLDSVRSVLDTGDESYYLTPPVLAHDETPDEWFSEYVAQAVDAPFAKVVLEPTGLFDRTVRYLPDTRTLLINTEHPFIEKMVATSKNNGPATLFGSSEVLVDVLMHEHGFSRAAIVDFLADRDKVLRLVAGEAPSTAQEVLRLLKSAVTHETALERAVGVTFRVLGFEYEKRGGNVPGPDGVLYARLGRGRNSLADYRLVYDSKQSDKPSVPADHVNIQSLRDFQTQERANYSFFLAAAYDAQDNPEGKLNRLVRAAAEDGNPVTLLRVEDLRRLVELHYRHGVTLTRLRSLFEEAHTVPEVKGWLAALEDELVRQEPQVPLLRLLEGLEDAKSDANARPNISAVRVLDNELKGFTPERLTASLQAVETIVGKRWIEVDTSSGDVRLHHTASQIVAEVERHLLDLMGTDALAQAPAKREPSAGHQAGES